MTTLAQLHDCHCCNDERSIVQKKIRFDDRQSLERARHELKKKRVGQETSGFWCSVQRWR